MLKKNEEIKWYYKIIYVKIISYNVNMNNYKNNTINH